MNRKLYYIRCINVYSTVYTSVVYINMILLLISISLLKDYILKVFNEREIYLNISSPLSFLRSLV